MSPVKEYTTETVFLGNMAPQKSDRKTTTKASWLHGGARYTLLLFGDIVAYYVCLILTLIIRYGAESFHGEIFYIHRYAFTIGLLLWLVVFYIGGLYDRQIAIRNVLDRRFFALVGVGGVLLILMFYFIPSFGITPKINLLIFVGAFAVIGYAWRMLFSAFVRSAADRGALRVMLIGSSVAADEVYQALSKNPTYGYAIAFWLKEGLSPDQDPEKFAKEVISGDIDVIVIPQNLEHEQSAVRVLYKALMSGAHIMSLPDFYERLFEKVSLSILDETWLIKNLATRHRPYHLLRSLVARFFAALLLLISSPLFIIIAVLVPLTSKGSVFYRQVRVGMNGKHFNLYKFRSMYSSTEKNPDAASQKPTWSTGKEDPRVTPLGRFLRSSHLDELPQLFNILRGDMAFVGPRPERPEFTAQLENQIPYYSLRTLIRPGIAGWAQFHYPYGESTADAYQKLQYDIYYLKHRSFWLDLTIILKTIKRFFVSPPSSTAHLKANA